MSFQFFVPSSFDKFVQNCQRLLSFGEPGLYYSFPYSGVERRIDQLVQDHSGLFDFPLYHIRFSSAYEDVADLQSLFEKEGVHIEKDRIGIFFSNTEYLLATGNSTMISWFIRLQQNNSKLGLIFFSEKRFSDEVVSSKLPSQFISNILYFPLCATRDALQFVEYLQAKWSLTLSDTKKHLIVKQCGGHLWLLKQTVRLLRDDPSFQLSNLYEHDSIQYRLKAIADCFDPDERNALLRPRNMDTSLSYYFTNLGIRSGNTITIPLLTKFLEERSEKARITLSDNKILINNVPITHFFSGKEAKIVKLFLTQSGKLVSRDAIALSLWPKDTDNHYSDWAIDQTIKRIRVKLQKLGLSPNSIKTVRSAGYLLSN